MNGNADVPNGPAATTIPMDSLITSRSFQTSQAVGLIMVWHLLLLFAFIH